MCLCICWGVHARNDSTEITLTIDIIKTIHTEILITNYCNNSRYLLFTITMVTHFVKIALSDKRKKLARWTIFKYNIGCGRNIHHA